MKAAVLILTLLGLPVAAWGPKGHRLTAEVSLRTLPVEVRAWYSGREAAFVEASLDADQEKFSDPEEKSRHRLRLEYYGGPRDVPFEEAVALRKLGRKTFMKAGRLPWAIGGRYQRLVVGFRSGDRAVVVKESAWLCHYVADAQVPLHTTRNNDGQETGQEGIHERWEQTLVDWKVDTLDPPRSALAATHPARESWAWIAEAHALVPALLDADERAKRADRGQEIGQPGEGPYWTRFWDLQKAAVTRQLQRSAERTGDLLLAAWIEAGKPSGRTNPTVESSLTQ